MRAFSIVAWLVAFGLGLAPTAADAAILVRSYTTTATFTSGPYATVNLKYAISFDEASRPTLLSYASDAGAPLNNRPDSVATFREFADQPFRLSLFFADGRGSFSASQRGYDLLFPIDGQGNPNGPGSLSYTVQGGTVFYTSATFVTIVAPLAPAAVPEPGTWVIMIAGFAIVGVAMRRHGAAGSIAA